MATVLGATAEVIDLLRMRNKARVLYIIARGSLVHEQRIVRYPRCCQTTYSSRGSVVHSAPASHIQIAPPLSTVALPENVQLTNVGLRIPYPTAPPWFELELLMKALFFDDVLAAASMHRQERSTFSVSRIPAPALVVDEHAAIE